MIDLMISASEARSIINGCCGIPQMQQVDISECCGCVLSKDISASINLPPFDQSSMDGYAFSFESWDKLSPLPIRGEVRAGAQNTDKVPFGCAIRIFTGAPLPEGTDTVVMQEKVRVENNQIQMVDPAVVAGQNVRTKGSRVKQGALVLPANTYINPAGAGLLASIGLRHVSVFSKPTVTIVITGNELTEPGERLLPGKIYDSSSYSLIAALKELSIYCEIIRCTDSTNEITMAIQSALEHSHLVLISGGVSVGDYDFTLPALKQAGAVIRFHQVKQRPGKPFCLATLNGQMIFGLPGNPASVLVCFYEYVQPAILKLSCELEKNPVKRFNLSKDFEKPAGWTFFLRGKINGKEVTVLPGQESDRLDTFAHADCIIHLDESRTRYHAGDMVDVRLLT